MKTNNFINIIGFLIIIFFIPSFPIKGNEKNNNFLNSETLKDNESKIETVETIGFGITIEAAVKDATVNALKLVSGTFIDEETSYKNKYSFNDGLTNETETFKEKIRSNSQGSIKSYEVLSTKKVGSEYKVKVKFVIKFE